jgi:hypothetical protein
MSGKPNSFLSVGGRGMAGVKLPRYTLDLRNLSRIEDAAVYFS